MKQEIIQGDCLEVMKTFKDKQFDLVLTDPPYGIGADKGSAVTFGQRKHLVKKYKGDWDSRTPPKEIFEQIIRVSEYAIIFGGQFFTDKLPPNGHWIVWDKKGGIDFYNPFGDCELAWTNLPRKSVKKYTVIQQGFISEEKDRWHPTQKPVALFKAILSDYLKEGDGHILDCYMGSGTTLVAAKQLGRSAVGIEISEKYCEIARQRLKQESLFAIPTSTSVH